MNIPHSEEEKEEDFLEYLYMGWKSGTEIWPHQVKMHLELMDAELKRLESGLMESGYLRKRAENSGYRLTELGKVQGEECLLRHHNLTQFLQMTCGLEEEEAEENACRMEHVISGNVLQGVQEFLKYGETYDRVVRDVDLRYLYPEGRYFPDSGAASAGGGESPQGEARAGTKAEDADRGKKCGLQETLPHCALDRLYSDSMCCGDVCNYGDDQ